MTSGGEVKIDRFVGEFAFLSNFHPSTIYVNGVKYATIEHAYQAAKTNDQLTSALIASAKSPSIAKKLGRTVALREDWEDVKFDLMKKLIRLKFENPFLRPMLDATGDAELIEVNFWNDTTWGVCRGVGKNHLGRILQEVREENREKDAAEK